MGEARRRYTELGHRLTEIVGSQSQLARIWGITRQAVAKRLQGRSDITIAELQRVADRMHVPMTVFFEKRGTDGGVLDAFHAMHMHGPDLLDRIINAFRHNRRTLRKLAEFADQLVAETEPEIRRRDRIFTAGVANSGVAIPPPLTTEEVVDEGEDDNQAHHGVRPDERRDPRNLGRSEDEI